MRKAAFWALAIVAMQAVAITGLAGYGGLVNTDVGVAEVEFPIYIWVSSSLDASYTFQAGDYNRDRVIWGPNATLHAAGPDWTMGVYMANQGGPTGLNIWGASGHEILDAFSVRVIGTGSCGWTPEGGFYSPAGSTQTVAQASGYQTYKVQYSILPKTIDWSVVAADCDPTSAPFTFHLNFFLTIP